MENREIKYLLAIAEHQNITHAAESLYLSQSALSRYLANVEKEIGGKLFIRENNSLYPTDLGEIYLKYCREIRESEIECNQAISHYLTGSRKFVTLGIPNSRLEHMQKFLIDFLHQHKEYEVRIVTGSSMEIEKKGKQKAIDLSVVNEDVSTLHRKLLAKEEIFLCIPEDIQKEKGLLDPEKPVRLQDLQDEVFYISDESNMLGRKAKEIFQKESFQPKEVKIFATSWLSMKLADENHAIAFGIKIGNDINHNNFFSMMDPVYNHVYLTAVTEKGKMILNA